MKNTGDRTKMKDKSKINMKDANNYASTTKAKKSPNS
jgi:hypothetical protein